MREAIERDEEERPEPVGQRWIVKNREDAFASVDSFGLIWTVYLPSALAFTSEEAAFKWIASRFHAAEISAHGIAPLDVSTWPTRPLHALGDGR